MWKLPKVVALYGFYTNPIITLELYSVQTRLKTPTTTRQKEPCASENTKTNFKTQHSRKENKALFLIFKFWMILFLFFFPLIVFLSKQKSSVFHIATFFIHYSHWYLHIPSINKIIYIYIYIYIHIYSNNPSYLFCFWLFIWELKLQRLNLSCPPLNFIYFSNFRCCFLG